MEQRILVDSSFLIRRVTAPDEMREVLEFFWEEIKYGDYRRKSATLEICLIITQEALENRENRENPEKIQQYISEYRELLEVYPTKESNPKTLPFLLKKKLEKQELSDYANQYNWEIIKASVLLNNYYDDAVRTETYEDQPIQSQQKRRSNYKQTSHKDQPIKSQQKRRSNYKQTSKVLKSEDYKHLRPFITMPLMAKSIIVNNNIVSSYVVSQPIHSPLLSISLFSVSIPEIRNITNHKKI
ncbi:MAG: hypothetical protein F6K58_17945 [Symploca sp. SIO2E9]|nr:hypothetical protein [Symploca sp. SIO2E9]